MAAASPGHGRCKISCLRGTRNFNELHEPFTNEATDICRNNPLPFSGAKLYPCKDFRGTAVTSHSDVVFVGFVALVLVLAGYWYGELTVHMPATFGSTEGFGAVVRPSYLWTRQPSSSSSCDACLETRVRLACSLYDCFTELAAVNNSTAT